MARLITEQVDGSVDQKASQPLRKAIGRQPASLSQVYWPPSSGYAEDSSAYSKFCGIMIRPPTIKLMISMVAEPAAPATSAREEKMPEPTVVPTATASAAPRPSFRLSSPCAFGVSFLFSIKMIHSFFSMIVRKLFCGQPGWPCRPARDKRSSGVL